jgi:hypothetical protein
VKESFRKDVLGVFLNKILRFLRFSDLTLKTKRPLTPFPQARNDLEAKIVKFRSFPMHKTRKTKTSSA